MNLAGSEAGTSPQRIRFFRRQMNNMITKACKDIGIPAAASRRAIALQQWLDDRLEHFYPNQPNYQSTTTTSVQMFSDPPHPLPAALIGDKWTFASLTATLWGAIFGWALPCDAFPRGSRSYISLRTVQDTSVLKFGISEMPNFSLENRVNGIGWLGPERFREVDRGALAAEFAELKRRFRG